MILIVYIGDWYKDRKQLFEEFYVKIIRKFYSPMMNFFAIIKFFNIAYKSPTVDLVIVGFFFITELK